MSELLGLRHLELDERGYIQRERLEKLLYLRINHGAIKLTPAAPGERGGQVKVAGRSTGDTSAKILASQEAGGSERIDVSSNHR